jgi:hypothetical protein
MVSLTVVDTDGNQVSEGWAKVEPAEILTDASGRNAEEIRLTARRPGVYLVTAEYLDRTTKERSYSMPVIVLSH